MRNSLFPVLLLSLLSSGLFAQDKIHVFNSPVIEAKVLEVSESEVVYKDFSNLRGPNYRLHTGRISFIEFENGTRQVFNQVDPARSGPYADPYYDGLYGLDYRWGGYYYGDRRLRGQDLADYIGYSLYGSQYRKATNHYFWGISLTGAGAIILAASVFEHISSSNFNNFSDDPFFDSTEGDHTGCIVGYIASAACLGAGIPLWVSGDRKLRAIADDYNKNYGRQGLGYSSTFTVGPTLSGFGLALNF